MAEVAQIINAADLDPAFGLGLRDRAILETLYSSAMRRAELVALDAWSTSTWSAAWC